MESYRTEEEQVEALKRWWQENGRSTVIGVVLALGLGFGWQAWQKNQQQAAENASVLYQQMLQALASEDPAAVDDGQGFALRLKDEYRGSTYAQFAALHLARLAVLAGQLDTAESELRWVLAMADEGSDVQQVARLRLARVMAAAGQAEDALALLQESGTDYTAAYAMARGDILLQLGREAEALTAFENAAAALDPAAPVPRTLQEKLQYLGARQAAMTAEAG